MAISVYMTLAMAMAMAMAKVILTIMNWIISYLDSSRGVQENTSIQPREFPRAAPSGTPSTSCWYFPVLPSSRQCRDSLPAGVN